MLIALLRSITATVSRGFCRNESGDASSINSPATDLAVVQDKLTIEQQPLSQQSVIPVGVEVLELAGRGRNWDRSTDRDISAVSLAADTLRDATTFSTFLESGSAKQHPVRLLPTVTHDTHPT
jgi:hypothetical protein